MAPATRVWNTINCRIVISPAATSNTLMGLCVSNTRLLPPASQGRTPRRKSTLAAALLKLPSYKARE